MIRFLGHFGLFCFNACLCSSLLAATAQPATTTRPTSTRSDTYTRAMQPTSVPVAPTALLQAMRKALDDLKQYHLQAVTQLQVSPGAPLKINTTLEAWADLPKRKLRFEAMLDYPGPRRLQTIMVFDRHWLWITMQPWLGKKRYPTQRMKVELASTLFAGKRFHNGYTLTGAGLLPGEEYVSTMQIFLSMYRWRRAKARPCVVGRCFVLEGTLRPQHLFRYLLRTLQIPDQRAFQRALRTYEHLRLMVDPATFLVREYEIGTSPAKLIGRTSFRLLDTRPIDRAARFVSGVKSSKVRDLTVFVKTKQARLKRMQLRFLRSQKRTQ